MKEYSTLNMKLMQVIFMGFGIIVTLLGMHSGYQRYKLYSNGVKTVGTVVEVIHSTTKKSDGKLSTYFYPIVVFTTPDEETHKFRSGAGTTNSKKYFEGGQVDLIYNPARPSQVELIIDASESWWAMPLGVMILGFIFLVVAKVLMVVFDEGSL